MNKLFTAVTMAALIAGPALAESANGTGFAQTRTGTAASSQVAQYCVLPPDSPDAHRFYCEHADGWSGRAGNARV